MPKLISAGEGGPGPRMAHRGVVRRGKSPPSKGQSCRRSPNAVLVGISFGLLHALLSLWMSDWSPGRSLVFFAASAVVNVARGPSEALLLSFAWSLTFGAPLSVVSLAARFAATSSSSACIVICAAILLPGTEDSPIGRPLGQACRILALLPPLLDRIPIVKCLNILAEV